MFKISQKTLFLLIAATIFLSGCSLPWSNQEEDESNIDSEVTKNGSQLELIDKEKIDVSTEGLVAGSFDGPIVWSPSGKYLAFHLSNMTMASTQVLIVDAQAFEQVAVVNGYDFYWDQEDSDKVIFTRHLYYPGPEYGSYESQVRVDFSDLLANEIFNEEEVDFEVVVEGEIADISPQGCGSVLDSQGVICSSYTADNRHIVYTKPEDGYPALYAISTEEEAGSVSRLSSEDFVVNAFALHPREDIIIYRGQEKSQVESDAEAFLPDIDENFFIAKLK